MVKTIKILTLLLIIASCKSIEENGCGQIPVVDIENNINSFEDVYLSEITDDIVYIPLETNTNSFLEYIGERHLVVTEEQFIIRNNISCKAYNRDGKYVCDYGSRGKGPGQYITNDFVTIDEKNKKMYLSVDNQGIIEYSYDAAFLRNIPIPDSVRKNIGYGINFLRLHDNIFCSMPNVAKMQYILFFFNDNKKVLGSYPNYYNDPSLKGSQLNYSSANMIYLTIGDRILFKQGLCDTAFYLTTTLQREPAYYFNLGKYSRLKEYLKSIKSDNHDLKGLYNHIFVSGFIETKDFLLFTCEFRNHIPRSEYISLNENLFNSTGTLSLDIIGNANKASGIFNRKTSELVFLKKTDEYRKDYGGFSGFVNDIDGGIPFWPIAHYNENELVYAVNACDLKLYVASDAFKNSKPMYPDKKKALEQLADSLDCFDNPVLMVVRIKNEGMKE